MAKETKQICERCGKEIKPATYEQNAHNLIMLGWTTGKGTVINARHNICTKCADAFDKWLKG